MKRRCLSLVIRAELIGTLDHGYVRLVSHTKPAGEVDYYWTGDQEIIRNARVSYGNDGEVRTIEQDKKLIDYLYKNRHTSPFEAMVFTFEVKAPIFVFRQWHRQNLPRQDIVHNVQGHGRNSRPVYPAAHHQLVLMSHLGKWPQVKHSLLLQVCYKLLHLR